MAYARNQSWRSASSKHGIACAVWSESHSLQKSGVCACLAPSIRRNVTLGYPTLRLGCGTEYEGQIHDRSSSSVRGEPRQPHAALLASASAETCVTGVNQTFANVVNGVSGQQGTTVVTDVAPTMASAVNGVTPSAVPFLTSAALSPGTTGTAITGVSSGSVTGLNPGATSNLMVPAFDPSANPSNTRFAFANNSLTTSGSGAVNLVNVNTPTPTVTLTNATVVSGTVAPPQPVLTGVTNMGTFLTSQSSVKNSEAIDRSR